MDAIRRLLLLRNALWSATAPLARQLLDACATATIVIAAVAMGARTYDGLLARVEASEGIVLARDPMLAAAVSFAESGRWPESSTLIGQRDRPGKYTERVEPGAGGGVHVFFSPDAHPLLRDRHLTARPLPGGDGATLRWRLAADDTAAGEPINPSLVPYAWRLDNKEP